MKTFFDYFEIIKFASPETNVRLKDSANVPVNHQIIIKKCLNWEDVLHLLAADSILTRNDIYVNWYIPYKPFARQDRTTALNHANESELLETILGGLDDRFIFLDTHSDKHSFGKQIDQFAPIKFYSPFGKQTFGSFGEWRPGFHLIVPDFGAQKKVPNNFEGRATYCDKSRDPTTGKLSGFVVPEVKTKLPMVLVDDICDGGGTFIGIAEHLQKYRKKNKLILYVTHGLFTKGIVDLVQFFDQIVTTNSVLSIESPDERLKILDVLCDDFVKFGIEE